MCSYHIAEVRYFSGYSSKTNTRKPVNDGVSLTLACADASQNNYTRVTALYWYWFSFSLTEGQLYMRQETIILHTLESV